MVKLAIKIDDAVITALWAHDIPSDKITEYILSISKDSIGEYVNQRIRILNGETK